MLKNLANSLIKHESIETTKTRAKAVVPFVERLITIGKREGELHHSRIMFDRLRNKESLIKLQTDIIPRMRSRNSGYLRTVKTRNQSGDNSLLFRVSFVDFEPKSRREKLSKKKATEKKSAKSTKKVEKKKVDDKKGSGLFGRFRGEKKEDTKSAQVKGKVSTDKTNTRSGI
jgi:large subunit ribosomal protein L17